MRKRFVLVLCGLVLAGCANMAQSMMITADTALVSVSGTNGDSRSHLVNAALVEAAKLTRAQGFRYFIVLDTADASTVSHIIVPPARVYAEGASGILSLRPKTSTAQNASMQTPVGESIPYVRPGLDTTIRMYRAGEVDPAMDGVWSVDALLSKTRGQG